MKSKSRPKSDWWKPALLLAAIAAFLLAAKILHLDERLGVLQGWIKSLGPWGPVVFALIYIVAVVAALPATIFTFLAGVLFGTVVGVVVVNIGATAGACLAFLVGRYFARGAVEKLIAKNKDLRKLDQWTARNGVWVLILVRLAPLLPFNLTNYAFSLTRIGFWPYALCTWLFMIPWIIVYVGGADAVHQGLSQGRIPWGLVGIVGTMILLLAGLTTALRRKTRKLS